MVAGFSLSESYYIFPAYPADTDLPSRGLGYPCDMHNWPQTSLRRYPGSFTRDLMDTGQYRLHVQLVLDVPLGPRRALRIQRWGLRQSEHVGADR